MLAPGSRIGPYEVIAPLGAGGMGEVYRARDTRIGREVALKVLPAEVATDRDRLERFQREAESAGALNHPNLLTIHELGVDGDRPYIVSELLEGTTLRDRLNSGPIPQRKAADYALQIAEGLAAAHDKAIVHRDLKPENIFITRDGRVKILDFGLAKLRSIGEVRADQVTVRQQTDPGTVLGTAGYMSPEQVRGETTDARSDIFSLGVSLYEMLTGRRAFKAPSSVETMNAILNNDPPEISSSINAQISSALQRIVNHCLEKNPEERFQSARDLAFDLESLSDTTSATKAIGGQGKRRPLLVPLGIAAAIALMAITAAFFAGKRFGRTPAPVFRRLTYHSSLIPGARFAPDGRSIASTAPRPPTARRFSWPGWRARKYGLWASPGPASCPSRAAERWPFSSMPVSGAAFAGSEPWPARNWREVLRGRSQPTSRTRIGVLPVTTWRSFGSQPAFRGSSIRLERFAIRARDGSAI